MKDVIIKTIILLIISCASYTSLIAQNHPLKKNYIGILPSILVEPYDTINAIEINTFPLVFEFRLGEQKDLGVQLRPIVNYRFSKISKGISQVGGTILANKYFPNLLTNDSWLIPQLGFYYTYAYNRLDKIQAMTFGIEPGVYMEISDKLSITLNLQPGINYYPDQFSRDFIGVESVFKAHFGIIFHVGYNF